MVQKYYQSDKTADRIDWVKIMPMDRDAGGHDQQMRGLLKDVTVIGHYNTGDYQGEVATAVQFNDTHEIAIYTDSYGSCSGCDAWEGADDEEVRRMCRQLACSAYVFKNFEDVKEFLSSDQDDIPSSMWTWDDVALHLLESIEISKIFVEPKEKVNRFDGII